MNINRPTESFIGLFAYAEYANIHDFSLTGQLVTNSDSGAVMGYAWNSPFSNLTIDVTINKTSGDWVCEESCDANQIGGVVGTSNNSDFNQLIVKAHIFGNDHLGGVAGSIEGGQLSEIAIQSILTGRNYLGGLAGVVNDAQIESLSSLVLINGNSAVGALVGASEQSVIKNILLSGSVIPGRKNSRYARGGSLMGTTTGDDISQVVSLVKLPEDPNERYRIRSLNWR